MNFFKKYLKKFCFSLLYNHSLVGGESFMSEFLWHWTKGNKKIYTTQVHLAEQAMKEGLFVMGALVRPSPEQ
jgi:hypothetical protein